MKLARLGSGPEIFHTIQGEGVSAGCPAVFIRASRCNLHCQWCDTEYTWNFQGTPWLHEKDTATRPAKHRKQDVTIEITPEEIAALVLQYQCPRLVLTGGEPLLQEVDFLEVIDRVRYSMADCVVEVETNGTRVPTPSFSKAVDQFNVSPKLANSGMDLSLRHSEEAFRHFAGSPKAWFKFVISTPESLDEVRPLIGRYDIPCERVILMPQGRSSAELDRISVWLAQSCRNLGFRFSDRLHVRLWGDTRGV
jgi:7-carboxy-7-deazaguanine synthase